MVANQDQNARRQLAEIIGGVRRGFCIRALAQFQIPDHLDSGPRTVEELAAATGLDPASLGRVLNVMGDIGVLERDPSGNFANSELSDLLRDDIEGSLRNYVLFRTDRSRLAPWMELPSVLKSGQPVFETVHGRTSTEYKNEHPEFGVTFNKMMKEVYQGDGERIAQGFDFGRFGSILDVGGGLGHVIAQVLIAHPEVSGGLYDLPAVTDGAEKILVGQELAGRCVCRDRDRHCW